MPSLLQVAQEVTLSLAANVTPLLIGERGIGKSAIIRTLAYDKSKQYAKLRFMLWGDEAPVNYINLRGSLHEAADFSGLPFISGINGSNGDGDHHKTVMTDFAPPVFLPQVSKHGERGILFLDEIFRAQVDVQQAIFQLIEHQLDDDNTVFHQCGRYILPEGWDVVAASNPPRGNKYRQNALLDSAFMDRFVHLKVKVDDSYLTEWASVMSTGRSLEEREEAEKILIYTSSRNIGQMFLGQIDQIVDEAPATQTNVAFNTEADDVSPSPRTWEAVLRVSAQARRFGIYGEKAHRRVLSGMIGTHLVHDYLNTMPSRNINEILNDDSSKWADMLLDMKRNEVKGLIWILLGRLDNIQSQERRSRVLDFISILISANGSADNWDLVVPLIKRITVLGAEEVDSSNIYDFAVVNDDTKAKMIANGLTVNPPPSFWLAIIKSHPDIINFRNRLLLGQ